jgi:hypothetical protein
VTRKDDGPGVPEGIPRTLQGLVDRLGADSLDRLWIFAPRIKGRRESGLVVVSRYAEDGDPTRRSLFTASYAAERTGKGLTVEWSLSEEGTAPPDRLPPVVEGVLRRSGEGDHEVREVGLGGDEERLEALFEEWERGMLDPELWPVAVVEDAAPVDGDEEGAEAAADDDDHLDGEPESGAGAPAEPEVGATP